MYAKDNKYTRKDHYINSLIMVLSCRTCSGIKKTNGFRLPPD